LSDKPTLLQKDEVIEWFGSKKEFIHFHESNRELIIQYLKDLTQANPAATKKNKRNSILAKRGFLVALIH
jgi:hypothetical protein